MPLKTGKSKATISSNIGELIDSYKRTGKIGASHPKSAIAARKQAVAISFAKAGKSRKRKAT